MTFSCDVINNLAYENSLSLAALRLDSSLEREPVAYLPFYSTSLTKSAIFLRFFSRGVSAA